MLEQLGSHALPRTSQGPSTDLVVGPNAGRAISALEAVASAGGNDITQELRDAVCEYVGFLKAEGLMAEHAIILLNRIMHQVGLDERGGHRAPLVDNVILLCVEEFYEASA